jgi:hypothetical protein
MAMSDEHKAALARGRREAAAIKRYLEALERRRPGRPITVASLQAKLDQVNRQIGEETDPLKRVDLVQTRIDTGQRIESFEEVDYSSLEAGFAKYGAGYSDRKGISYSAWREIGVPAAVLRQAGIPRTRRS